MDFSQVENDGLQPGGERWTSARRRTILPAVLIDILLHDEEAENTAHSANRPWSRHITIAQTNVTRGSLP